MKTSAKFVCLALLSTAFGFAETPAQSPFGAWTIYHAAGNRVFMLQTLSHTSSSDAGPGASPAKLDVICRGGKLTAIALEPSVAIDKKDLSFTGVVPVTRVGFIMNDDNNRSENWAVLDDGHALSPYSQLFQGRLNRRWVEQISGTDKLAHSAQAQCIRG